MSQKTFYITTPIYYPSDKLHIGHAYCTVAADAMARYKRLRGYDVLFHTGTDEHGQKIEQSARQKGMEPKAYVDEIVASILQLWETMDIAYDRYYRTTDPKHIQCVQKIFKQLYDQGDIYKSEYEGWYCTPCETFFTELQLVDGKCPDCNRPVERVKEESYFFRLSKYQDRILKLLESGDFLLPKTRQNEMINNFIKPGLEDLAVSRTSFKWGIPVEFDPGHVVYVWIDALSNYITALGYLTEEDAEYKKYWPADIHLVGKEIVRFHSIIWPAILMALGEELPKRVFGHGWLVIDGGKMSKSKGNVVDPYVLTKRYGVDAIRYFLLREAPFGSDVNFTNEVLIQRINADLANDLGNLLSRTVGMIEKYFAGVLPESQGETPYDQELIGLVSETVQKVETFMDEMQFSEALNSIWVLVRRANKFIDEMKPWELVKEESRKDVLAKVLYNLAEVLRVSGVLIQPVMPNTPKEIARQLNFSESLLTWDSLSWGLLPKSFSVSKGEAVFPRIDLKKELQVLEELNQQTQKAALANQPRETKADEKQEITIDEFDQLSLKVGTILACEKVEGSDKLLKSQIKIGEETRQIVSGLAKVYTPEEMVGKDVIVVANLKPVKLRGVLSNGMILAATAADGTVSIVTPDKANMNGTTVS